MTRRASLPGADELFRSTTQAPTVPVRTLLEEPVSAPAPVRTLAVKTAPAHAAQSVLEHPPGTTEVKGSRPKHEQKVTFYCTDSDLTDLERVRLALRAEHRLPADRSRIVRAALAEILDDFESWGASSMLVRRLKEDKS